MRGVIRIGDSTSHGGEVIGGAAHSVVMGRPVARIGDQCSCPIHHDTTIAEGDGTVTIEGRAVAFDGHKTACGATLISSAGSTGKA